MIFRVYQALPEVANAAKLDGLWQEFDQLSHSSELLAKTLLASNRQLMEVSNELQILGDKHRDALKMVSKRDGQLEIANDKLEKIGLEHEQALKQLAKYERISQFPPIRLVVNGVRKGARLLYGRSHGH